MLALPPQPLRGAWNPVLPWGGDVATMQASTPMLKQVRGSARAAAPAARHMHAHGHCWQRSRASVQRRSPLRRPARALSAVAAVSRLQFTETAPQVQVRAAAWCA
jgi:hypothetical protein